MGGGGTIVTVGEGEGPTTAPQNRIYKVVKWTGGNSTNNDIIGDNEEGVSRSRIMTMCEPPQVFRG